jgi:hypothetical protein
MAKHFLLWSNENVYYELKLPSKTTIGRGDTNMIQILDHKSVSTNHASIIIEDSLINPLEYTCWIEDHSSRNGTFCGISPNLEDFEKVNGKKKLTFGDYIRFGSSSFYRFLEFPPPLAPNAPDPIKENLKPIQIIKEDLIKPISKTNLFNTTQNILRETLRDSKNIVFNNDKDNKDSKDDTNMSILINYGSKPFERPIAVVVDPISPSKQDQNQLNNGQLSPSIEYRNRNKRYDDNNRYSERYDNIEEEYVEQDYDDIMKNIQKNIPSSNTNTNNNSLNNNNTSINFADNNIKKLPSQLLYSHDENTNNNYHGNNNKCLQLDNTLDELLRQEYGERVDLGDTNYSNDFNNNNKNNNNSNMIDSKDFLFPGGSTSFDMKSSKMNFPKFKNKKDKNTNRLKNKPHSQLEELNIPSSSEVDYVVNTIIGTLYKYKIGDDENFSYTLMKDIKSSRSNEKFTDIINSTNLSSNKETQKILAEILVENMQDDSEITVSYQLNEVINNLKKLLQQSKSGMDIKQDLLTGGVTSAEFNGILDEVLKSMVSDTIDILRNVQSGHLFYALRTSNENGYDQFDKIIENSIERLEKLLLFQNEQYLIEEYSNLSQVELYEIDSFVYSIIVEEVDFVSRIINRIVQLTFGNVIKPSLSNSNSPIIRSSTNLRNILSTEVEEIRRIKNNRSQSTLDSKRINTLINNKAITTKKNTELKSFFFHLLKKFLKNETRLIYRLVRPYSNMLIGIIRKSFLHWERINKNMKLVETLAKVEDETALQRENSKLKCDNYVVNSRIHKLERSSDTLTSLQAEKSLNRYNSFV